MRTRFFLSILILAGLLTPLAGVAAQNNPTLTPERVRTAIKNGVEYLKTHQGKDGSWEHLGITANRYKGGLTSLAMLALLEAGVDVDDQVITDGLKYLRKLESEDTYVVGLQTMVLSHARPEQDQNQIKANVDWLRQTVKRDSEKRVTGWGYPKNIPGSDNSNTQYAVLALREASQAGVGIDDKLWKDIQDYYVRTQLDNGGWPYRNDGGRAESDRLTMNAAGVCGLLITGMQLYRNLETIDPVTGTIKNCGEFEKNDPLAKGLRRLADTFTVDFAAFRYYNLYGLERAGRLSGQRFFTGQNKQPHDWYRAGAEYLLRSQMQPEGCWRGDNAIDGHPVIATSFALLFLAKGKTPVLVHKMIHGLPVNERGVVGDWNNDRNDIRNLTEYCSKEIFKKNGRPVPLTWQAFDASKLDPGDPLAVAKLLQAPIVYINGHLAPKFTDGEKKLLKDYVEQGGFILAEACCGRKEFDEGFRKLVKEIWKDQPDKRLEPLSEGHPVWTAAFPVAPGSFKLEGVDFGCKTCLIYAPEDLSCHWETNHFKGPEGRTELAFRIGANIVAYATGLEPPEDKLTKINVVSDKPDLIRRNHLHVAQLNYGGRDWQPAPKAMRNLMDHVQKGFDVDVILQTRPMTPGDPNLPDYKFLYMHGRREFSIPEESRKRLREHLEGGGILLADACCGNDKFDKSFRDLMQQMFPDRKLEPIKLNDPLFSDKVGKKIGTVQCRTQRGSGYVNVAPQFEGIRLDPTNPRSPWVVVYSKYDLGCALDRHSTTDCLGYSHESALELASQVVLYALKE